MRVITQLSTKPQVLHRCRHPAPLRTLNGTNAGAALRLPQVPRLGEADPSHLRMKTRKGPKSEADSKTQVES
jgi:hypothetical protein